MNEELELKITSGITNPNRLEGLWVGPILRRLRHPYKRLDNFCLNPPRGLRPAGFSHQNKPKHNGDMLT